MKRANPFKKTTDDKMEDKGLAGLTKQALSKPPAKAPESAATAKVFISYFYLNIPVFCKNRTLFSTSSGLD